MKRKRWVGFVLLLMLFGALFLVSATMILRTLAQAQKEKRAFEELAGIVSAPVESTEDAMQPEEREPEETGDAENAPAPIETPSPYALIKERNPDFFGWIYIEDTGLDYPVMHTPEDEEYYLRRDFAGKKAQGGVPFLAAACYEGCGNYILYGHNMKNGSMFAPLLHYAEREYWQEHPLIGFDTYDTAGEYEVLAAFYSQSYPKDVDGVFRYYRYTDLTDPEVFAEYVEQVKKSALYDTGVSAEYGDELLTLSTCSYHTENGRFVVVARKKAQSGEE